MQHKNEYVKKLTLSWACYLVHSELTQCIEYIDFFNSTEPPKHIDNIINCIFNIPFFTS